MKKLDRQLIEEALEEMKEGRMEKWLTFAPHVPETDNTNREEYEKKRLKIVKEYLSEKPSEACKECSLYVNESLRGFCELLTDRGYCEDAQLRMHTNEEGNPEIRTLNI